MNLTLRQAILVTCLGISGGFLVVGASADDATTQSATAPTTVPEKKRDPQRTAQDKEARDKAASIGEGLKNSDPDVQKKSLEELMTWIEKDPARAAFSRQLWMPSLFETKRYEVIATITDKLIIKLPSAAQSLLSTMFPYRIEALLKLKKNDEALIAAKQYYNSCTMQQSASAIVSVAQCLRAAHPDDKDIDSRFRAQQQDQLATTTAASLDKVPAAGSSLLDTIKINPAPYDDQAAKYAETNYKNLLVRGNLALLADKPGEAKDLFEQAYANRPAREAAEGIARSIRALHRSVGAANAWILSLQASTTTAPANDKK